jgi:hypothetical protein
MSAICIYLCGDIAPKSPRRQVLSESLCFGVLHGMPDCRISNRNEGNYGIRLCNRANGSIVSAMQMSARVAVAAVCGLFCAGIDLAAPVLAGPAAQPDPAVSAMCNDAFCTPGIAGNAVLGAPCGNTSFYVFGVTSWGRLVFCGSPRRYEPRYFRAMPMVGIKELNTDCTGRENYMAQAPDGLFLTCTAQSGATMWTRGDA